MLDSATLIEYKTRTLQKCEQPPPVIPGHAAGMSPGPINADLPRIGALARRSEAVTFIGSGLRFAAPE